MNIFKDKPPYWLIPAIAGALIGLLLVLVGTYSLLHTRSYVLAANIKASWTSTPVPPTDTPVPTSTPTRTPRPTSTITPTESPSYDEILKDAENKIENLDTEEARKELEPLLTATANLKTLSRINELLGDSYVAEGLTKMAVGYYDTANTQNSNPDVLFKLAITLNTTGEMERSLEIARKLVNWPGADADKYRDLAQAIIESITGQIYTPDPRPTLAVTPQTF